MLPHFKLLHVVRDGRDIAFSANQGPVVKFYKDMYGADDHHLSTQVKGIKLWSDWNSQVFHWAEKYVEKLRQSAQHDKSFSYFVIHAEDLVSGSRAVRYSAIAQVASFVGSSLNTSQLCCLAVQESEFLGSHERKSAGSKSEQVASRYGKWHAKLSRNKQLSDSLHAAGSEGLRIFGYEPERKLADDRENSGLIRGLSSKVEKKKGSHNRFLLENTCTDEIAERCLEIQKLKRIDSASEWGADGSCEIYVDADFKGGDLKTVMIPYLKGKERQKDFCCRICKTTAGCRYFTADPHGGICYLKNSKQEQSYVDGLISGSVVS